MIGLFSVFSLFFNLRPRAVGADPATDPADRSSALEDELNPLNTFDSFVVGWYNQFAQSAALAVAQRSAFNPLFLYGAEGAGKTHLMHAIYWHTVSYSKKRAVYCSGERLSDLTRGATRVGTLDVCWNHFREADVILLDDIQSLAGEKIQGAFLRLFDTLYFQERKQFVFAGICPPGEILGLDPQLAARFGYGLIAELYPRDIETRRAILLRKAQAAETAKRVD